MILSTDNAGKRWNAIQRNLLAWISGILLPLEGVWNSGWEIFYLFYLRLYFSWYLLTRTANVNKPNRFCYYVPKGHGFRENLASAIVSTSLIFMFVDQLLLVDVCSQLYYLIYAIKQQCRTYRYKSLNHEKLIISIWHSSLVYRFSPISVINR